MRFLDYVLWFVQKSPEEVAETPVYLAADPEAREITGRFFATGRPWGPDHKETSVPEDLRDPEIRDRLWRVSEELTGLASDKDFDIQ